MNELVIHGRYGKVLRRFPFTRELHLGTCPDCGAGVELVEHRRRYVVSPHHVRFCASRRAA